MGRVVNSSSQTGYSGDPEYLLLLALAAATLISVFGNIIATFAFIGKVLF